MTRLSRNQSPLKGVAKIRFQVYGLTFVILVLGAAVGLSLDTLWHTRPALTLIGVVVAYPIALLCISLFVSRKHGTGNDSGN